MEDQGVSSEIPNAPTMPERIWAGTVIVSANDASHQLGVWGTEPAGRLWDPAEYVRADLVAESPGPWPTEAEFELWQNDEFAAGTSGPREDALREILGYAATYGQDGPVTIYEVKRFQVSLPTPGGSDE